MLKRFAKYYKPHLALFIFDISCALFVTITDLIYPLLTRRLINIIIPTKNMIMILKFSLMLFLIYSFKMLMEYFVGYYGHVLGVRIEYDMRKEIFSHIQRLSFSYFDNTKTGQIMSRIVNDLREISELAHHGPEDIFLSVILLIGTFLVLLNINVKLTLVSFTIIPFMIYFMIKFNSKFESVFMEQRRIIADINSRIEDSISGIRVVKSFTNEEYEIKKFDEGNLRFKNQRTKAVRYIGIFDSVNNYSANIAVLITLTFGGLMVSKGEINVGDLVAFMLYIGQFLRPLTIILRFTEDFQNGMSGFKRFIEIIDMKPDIEDKEGAIELENVKGDIEFIDVKFSYDDKRTVLSNINFKIKSGETVAIVGPSGSGKTTLCNLIPRFYEIDEGRITIDGIDIKDIALKSLRRNIGIVQQDVFLFAGTIRENIAYGKLDATFEEIVEAAKAANAHDFIMQLPNGYDTYIGERGVKLSGGQKQRISIARMFLKNPPILILDEATSSLDNESEAIIQKSIEDLAKNRTTLIIAHRLATVKNADRIIVLTENGIEEEGSHHELLRKKGKYYSLYVNQFDIA